MINNNCERVSIVALESFFCIDFCKAKVFDKSSDVLNDHLFLIQTKLIPLDL